LTFGPDGLGIAQVGLGEVDTRPEISQPHREEPLNVFNSNRAVSAAKEVRAMAIVLGLAASSVMATSAILGDGLLPLSVAPVSAGGAQHQGETAGPARYTAAVASAPGAVVTGGSLPASAGATAAPGRQGLSFATGPNRQDGASARLSAGGQAASSVAGAHVSASLRAASGDGAVRLPPSRASAPSLRPMTSASARVAQAQIPAAELARLLPPAPAASITAEPAAATLQRSLVVSAARSAPALTASAQTQAPLARPLLTAGSFASAGSPVSAPAAVTAATGESTATCGATVGTPSWGPWAGDALNSGAYDSQGDLLTVTNFRQITGPLTGTLTAGDTFELVDGVWRFNPNSPGAIGAFGSAEAASQATGVPLQDWWGAGPPPPGVAC
jgi:hypothetical protein